jgi:hypothetical protein
MHIHKKHMRKFLIRHYHYDGRTLCQVLGYLPSAKSRALGKEAFCRVLALGKGGTRQIKEWHSVNPIFAKCKMDPWQRRFQVTAAAHHHFCWASTVRHSAKTCRVSHLTLGKKLPLPSVVRGHSANILYFFGGKGRKNLEAKIKKYKIFAKILNLCYCVSSFAEKSPLEGTRSTPIVFVSAAGLPAPRRLTTAPTRHFPASLSPPPP